MRQKSLFKRESREGEKRGEEGRGERRRGFSIMKFEICRTSKASVAKPLWQQSREEECISFSPSVSPISRSLFPPLHPSLSAKKCLSRAGWRGGSARRVREKGLEQLIRRKVQGRDGGVG